MIQIASLIFGIAMSASPLATPAPVDIQDLEPVGIRFLVDTKENMGYIVNEYGEYAVVPVGTGRKETVRYIGRTYYAATPAANWKAKSLHGFKDHMTFGKTGKFLRLYRNGDEYTSYGIHSYQYIDDLLKKDVEGRYYSMGCVLVSEDVMTYLIEAYKNNDNALELVTVDGIDWSQLTDFDFHAKEIAAVNGTKTKN